MSTGTNPISSTNSVTCCLLLAGQVVACYCDSAPARGIRRPRICGDVGPDDVVERLDHVRSRQCPLDVY